MARRRFRFFDSLHGPLALPQMFVLFRSYIHADWLELVLFASWGNKRISHLISFEVIRRYSILAGQFLFFLQRVFADSSVFQQMHRYHYLSSLACLLVRITWFKFEILRPIQYLIWSLDACSKDGKDLNTDQDGDPLIAQECCLSMSFRLSMTCWTSPVWWTPGTDPWSAWNMSSCAAHGLTRYPGASATASSHWVGIPKKCTDSRLRRCPSLLGKGSSLVFQVAPDKRKGGEP